FIARYPVTFAQFGAFVRAHGYHYMRYWSGCLPQAGNRMRPALWEEARWHLDNHPVVGVSWCEAAAFCQWFSEQSGLDVRLPSELQWEKAARGSDGRTYPWGERYLQGHANLNELWRGQSGHYLGRTTPVGLFPQGASPYGVLDMAGNVWEWCRDTFKPQESEAINGVSDRVLRGGSWDFGHHFAATFMRTGFNPHQCRDDIGFRVVTYGEPD
ncbi:MAG: formylglycine-generating enzyme family protein, partial [Anaerolineae bacterium]|nr:formylglycine-generating enzyme family protein [Anaerolineae bacterium]